ncbi:MAG: RNA methyltransferase [Flavobacterium sp.]|nr:RNA methyltransferase [Flavobacterium sp.]
MAKIVRKMVSKTELKYFASLLHKKQRTEEKKFIAEGKKLVDEALDSDYTCDALFATYTFEETHQSYCSALQNRSIRYERLSAPDFKKLCDTETPQGIAGVFIQKEAKPLLAAGDEIIVALENISDPGNLGTIIRNCDWFGVKNILLSRECAEVYNPKVLRASMGSAFHLNILDEPYFYETLASLKKDGFDILCADLKGENIFEYDVKTRSVLVFSNESHGPTHELVSISKTVTIPAYGSAESLNVANACAVILGYCRASLKTPTKSRT